MSRTTATILLALAVHLVVSTGHVVYNYGLDTPKHFEALFPTHGVPEYQESFPMISRIVKGDIAEAAVYKYLVELTIVARNGDISLCTATMLDARHLLGAGHCFLKFNNVENVDPSRSYARIGILDREDTTAPKVWFDSVYVFKDFDPRVDPSFKNDIAIVKLKTAIPSNSLFPTRMINPPRVGTLVQVAGYGDVSRGTASRWARQGKVMNDNFDTCVRAEDIAERWKYDSVTMVCSFPRLGVDTCQGDSGGPIFELVSGQMNQYGLTSFSNNLCLHDQYAGWYTKRSTFEGAIQQFLGGTTTAWKKIEY